MGDVMLTVICAVATLWGAVAGCLLPRPAYRLAVPAEEPWRSTRPGGDAFAGAAGGWFGLARSPDGHWYGPSTAATAALTASACGAFGLMTGPRPELFAWLLLVPVFVLLALIDHRVQRLPDPLTLPLVAAALGLLGVAAVLPEHGGRWLGSLYGALALGAGFLVLFLVNPRGMGFGDVKLALSLGAVLGWYGWGVLLLGTFAGFLLGALYGLVLVLRGKAGRRTSIPFGPFLIAGALLGTALGAYGA